LETLCFSTQNVIQEKRSLCRAGFDLQEHVAQESNCGANRGM